MPEYDIYLNDNGTPVKPKIDGRVEELENLVATGSTTPRSPQDRAADIVNVRDFGAVGDGVHDDSQAFIDAYNYAVSIGTRPFVPYGNYKLSKNVPSVQAGTFYCEGERPQYSPGAFLIVTRPVYDNEINEVSDRVRRNFRKAYRLNDPAKVQALLAEAAVVKRYAYDNNFTYGHYNTVPMTNATSVDCSGFCYWVLNNIGFTALQGKVQPYEHQDGAQTAFFEETYKNDFTKITSIGQLQAGDIVFMGTSRTDYRWHEHMYIYVDRNHGYSIGSNAEIQQPGLVKQRMSEFFYGGSTLSGVTQFCGGTDTNYPVTIVNDNEDITNQTANTYTGVRFVDRNYNLTTQLVSQRNGSSHAMNLTHAATNGSFMGLFLSQNDTGLVQMRFVANDTSTTSLTLGPSNAYVGTNFSPTTDNTRALGLPSGRWTQLYAASSTINTSDERYKTNIDTPDDALMKAWGKVNFKAYQFTDAVEAKGDSARIHFGVIAQQVAEAFASEGLDASRYALFCYDKWEDVYETVEVVDKKEVVDKETGDVIEPAVTHTETRLLTPAGDRYGIRYSEALALECAYQRWRLAKLEAKQNG